MNGLEMDLDRSLRIIRVSVHLITEGYQGGGLYQLDSQPLVRGQRSGLAEATQQPPHHSRATPPSSLLALHLGIDQSGTSIQVT